MVCAECNGDSKVIDSVLIKNVIHRKRKCIECGNIFYTMEIETNFNRIKNEWNSNHRKTLESRAKKKITVKDLIKKKDYDYIEWRLLINEDTDEDMFTGASASKDGKLISLDGDTYSEEVKVERSEEWSRPKKNIRNGLTIVYKECKKL